MEPSLPEILDNTPPSETDDIRCGYIVMMKHSGQLMFRLLGTQPGAIEILGLHEFASRKVSNAVDMNQSEGPFVITQQLKGLNSGVEALSGGMNTLSENMAALAQAMEVLVKAAGIDIDQALSGEENPALPTE